MSICPSISPAFFDDDAAAIRSPSSRTASTKRSKSGKAVNSPASISMTISCLRSAYSSTLVAASGTWKWSSAARAPLMRGLPDTNFW
jgi:hypothetical protein